MSRGLGRVQRAVLDVLDTAEDPMTVHDITRTVYACTSWWGADMRPSAAQTVAVRRALGGFRADGRAFRCTSGQRHVWGVELWAGRAVAELWARAVVETRPEHAHLYPDLRQFMPSLAEAPKD